MNGIFGVPTMLWVSSRRKLGTRCPFTANEVGDVHALEMYARVNGETWSQGNCCEMFHSWERMIEHVSMEETIYPTDILGSGTANRGCGLEIDRWLQPGDVIEIEIQNLGVLTNKIVRR